MNSGGFVAGASGTDFSQANGYSYTGSDLVIDAATNTKVTSASHNFVAADVGNILRITAGVGYTTGFYQIVSCASNAATLDRSPGAVGITGGTYYVGGAFASPGQAGAAHVAGNTIYTIGNYTITSASTNVAGGCVSLSASTSATAATRLVGCAASRNDGAYSVWTASGISTFTMVTAPSMFVEYISLNGASLTSSRGFSVSNTSVYKCKAANMTNRGFTGDATTTYRSCEATGCSSQVAFSSGHALFCTAYSNTIAGFSGLTNTFCCIAANNTGASSDGFINCVATNCVAYGNGRDGFRSNTTNFADYVNSVAVANGAYGFNGSGVHNGIVLYNCAAQGNSTADYNTTNILAANVHGFLSLSVSPFTNAAGSDFSLNNTSGGGASLRAAGLPGAFQGIATTTAYEDVGAVQHVDPAAFSPVCDGGIVT